MGELLHAIASAHQHETAQGQGRRGVIPAPVGGWNTQDPEAAMDPSFGTQMENYFPERGRVISRRGSKTYAETGSTSAVETLFNWVSGASNKLFALTSTTLYDVTDPANVSEVAGQTVTEGRWRSATMNGQGILVNGTDEPLRIDGTGSMGGARIQRNRAGHHEPNASDRVQEPPVLSRKGLGEPLVWRSERDHRAAASVQPRTGSMKRAETALRSDRSRSIPAWAWMTCWPSA